MKRSSAVRPVLAGLAGTAVMTTTTKLEAALRGERGQPMDYDDSRIPVRAVEHLTSLRFPNEAWEEVANRVLHYGYGSGAGLLRSALEGRVAHPDVAFFCVTWAAEITALPVLGLTAPVWRWRRDVLATSALQHVI